MSSSDIVEFLDKARAEAAVAIEKELAQRQQLADEKVRAKEAAKSTQKSLQIDPTIPTPQQKAATTRMRKRQIAALERERQMLRDTYGID